MLSIDYFEALTTTTSFPTNLTSLEINKIKNCKALMESQGLQRLASLTDLHLSGEDDGGLVSFPPAAENSKETEILLPRSLVYLSIRDFPNLKKLSKGFQFLTSLEKKTNTPRFQVSKLLITSFSIPPQKYDINLDSQFQPYQKVICGNNIKV
ncbi:hypothetical protein ACLB2K_075067 [Fragaria x ananassa]